MNYTLKGFDLTGNKTESNLNEFGVEWQQDKLMRGDAEINLAG